MRAIKVEACVSAENQVATEVSVRNAHAGGADTVELCRDLSCGGLTPDPLLIRTARRAFEERAGVLVMIRPRAGDFIYGAAELAMMTAQIEAAADAGADGVVFGALREDRIDLKAMDRLVHTADAHGLRTTFHRAFDAIPERLDALDELIQMGIHRVLTSGTSWNGGQPASSGTAVLNELLRIASGRIEIVVGGGIGPGTVSAVLNHLDLDAGPIAVHAYSSLLKNGITDAAKVAAFAAEVGRYR